jgi:hypothetical protein
MLNISKNASLLDSTLETKSYSIKIDPVYINIIITDSQEETVSFKIKKTDITQNPAFDEQTLWCINADGIENINSEKVLDSKYIIPIFVNTYNTKITPTQFCPNSLFNIFLPTKNLNDMIFRIGVAKENSETVFSGNTDEQITFIDAATYKDLISPITVSTSQTTVNAGDTITVNVTCRDNVETVYLDSIVGSLSKTRVNINNKTGSFKIDTTGLVSGDIVSVKLGYKYFTGVTVFNKTLA